MVQADLEYDLVVESEVKGHVTHSRRSPKWPKMEALERFWPLFSSFLCKMYSFKAYRTPREYVCHENGVSPHSWKLF